MAGSSAVGLVRWSTILEKYYSQVRMPIVLICVYIYEFKAMRVFVLVSSVTMC